MDGTAPGKNSTQPAAEREHPRASAARSGEERIGPAPAKEGRGWHLVDWSIFERPPELLASFIYFTAILAIVLLAATTINLVLRAFAPVWTGEEISAEQVRNLLIAIGALVAAPFAIWRIVISHWQARATQAQAKVGQEQARIAQENLYTGMLTKAVEQLGAMREVKETREVKQAEGSIKYETITKTVPNTEVRLGAIYALERIAQDSERDHWPIMETLCAYVRNNAKPMDPLPEDLVGVFRECIRLDLEESLGQTIDAVRLQRAPLVDVQAALVVLGRRSKQRRAHEARLAGAASHGDGYRLNLQNINLQGADLRGLDFSGALFIRTDLSLISAKAAAFVGAIFDDAILVGAELTRGDLSDSRFRNAALVGADMRRVRATGSDFDSADLTNAVLRFAQLTGCDLDNTSLARADLYEAGLSGVSMMNANLLDAVVRNVSFEAANLEGATFDRVNLSESDMKHAYLGESRLSEAVGISSQFLATTFGSSKTKLPEGQVAPDHWLRKEARADEYDDYLGKFFDLHDAARKATRDTDLH